MGSKPIDETGNRYGRLVVLEEAGRDKYRNCLWRCHCDCGNESIVNGASLRRGHTKSCGCFQREFASNLTFSKTSKLPPGQAALNGLYYNYKLSARKKGILFNLTKESFTQLTKMNCYYCGKGPSQVKTCSRGNGVYIYNGVDRVNNLEGYTIDNVAPCCGMCNKMKSNYNIEEFLKHVERIYKHKGDKNET